MSSQLNLKKTFLIGLVISLTLSALVGVLAFLFGAFGEVEFKIIATTLAVGLFSLTGLVNAVLLERKKYPTLAVTGLVTSIFGFLITEFTIWGISLSNEIWKFSISSIILSVAFAHASLILLNVKSALVKTLANVALLFIAVVSLMLIYLIFNSYPNPGEGFYRFLGAVAILDVLLTIVIPILNKISAKPSS